MGFVEVLRLESIMRAWLHIQHEYDMFKWWIMLGYGLSIDQHNYLYKSAEAAAKSAKRTALKLGITIVDAELHDNTGTRKFQLD